jgi:hypothetical protein
LLFCPDSIALQTVGAFSQNLGKRANGHCGPVAQVDLRRPLELRWRAQAEVDDFATCFKGAAKYNREIVLVYLSNRRELGPLEGQAARSRLLLRLIWVLRYRRSVDRIVPTQAKANKSREADQRGFNQ